MNRCAVVIGVNKTGDLPILQGAASGAQEFANWATSQGIEVALLTDSNESVVSLSDVKNAIRVFVQKKIYSQLIVFFSGHGILKAPDYELWLLSGAPSDPNDAVDVPGSIWLSRNAGIPHVVVISDACRSRPNTSRLSQIQGGIIFPNEDPKPPRPVVDVFYATLPGDPALEALTPDAVKNYSGIFTECLLKGLKGDVPAVIIDIGNKQKNETRWVVPSWELKPYLEEGVPEAASSISIKLQQDPDIRVESHLPKFLAEITQPLPPIAPKMQNQNMEEHLSYSRSLLNLLSDKLLPKKSRKQSIERAYRFLGAMHTNNEHSRDDFYSRTMDLDTILAMDRLLDVNGRQAFETSTGFTVIGAQPMRVIVTGGGECDLFEESGAYQIRVHVKPDNTSSISLLIQFLGGHGLPLAVLPGFIGTIVVEDGRVVNVTYLPSRDTPKFSEYQLVASEIDIRRAYVAVAARNGSFRLGGKHDAQDGARFLRVQKSIDPTLGLYASYAYAQAGDFEGVASVYEYMSYESVPIFFDVALLANKLPKQLISSDSQHQIAPFCPMLTQGWARLNAVNIWLPPAVRDVQRELMPGLWSTFGPTGVDILWSAIEKGELV